MIEKIKLTQEQAEAMEHFLACNGEDKSDLLDFHSIRKGAWSDIYTSLNALSQADLARALLIGYEVKLKFKVGDWVHVSWSNGGDSVHKVLKVGVRSIGGDLDGIAIDAEGNPKPPLRIVRHATAEEIAHEKEQRKWAEIKPGDVVISQISGAIAIYEGISPCYREVRVKKHNGAHQFWWNENNIELYAKKVGDE